MGLFDKFKKTEESGVEERSYVAKELAGKPVLTYTATTKEKFRYTN